MGMIALLKVRHFFQVTVYAHVIEKIIEREIISELH